MCGRPAVLKSQASIVADIDYCVLKYRQRTGESQMDSMLIRVSKKQRTVVASSNSIAWQDLAFQVCQPLAGAVESKYGVQKSECLDIFGSVRSAQ